MAQSEITHCFIKIDLFKQPHFFNLLSDEKLIYTHCLLQGAKNNLGIFREHRGAIALFLGVDPEICDNFFLKHPGLIGFCPDTHLIWVKPFFSDIDYGIQKDIWYYQEDKNYGMSRKFDSAAYYAKNNFITKINTSIKENILLRNHKFISEWVKLNYHLFDYINQEVKSVKGSGEYRNFDNLLKLAKVINN